jgi:hypothetical protein
MATSMPETLRRAGGDHHPSMVMVNVMPGV